MLNFFRKYQKIFFLLTTAIIVCSFVFFGTYQAVMPGFMRSDQEEESDVKQMVRFLNTEEWMSSRKFFAANFLNDGVISKEFLETGMAEKIVEAFPERFKKDFEAKWEKEKTYLPYTHPYLASLSAMSVWSTFAPDLPTKLKSYQKSNRSFKEKSALFLAQKNFPPAFLSQIIRYQQHNNPKVAEDPHLAKEDVALFGYHDLTDWFGESFMEAVAVVIMQTADLARKQGFKVSKEEVMSELLFRSDEIYKELKQRVNLPVRDGYGLFQFYLRQTGMSEERALKIWEDVTLFRRLMHTVGDAALVDPFAFKQFYAYAYENALVEVLQMAQSARLSSMEDLKKFETYLAAVGSKKASALDIPLDYAPIDTIEERAPELVGKHYQLHYAEITKKSLQAKVSIKETLQWECASENWQLLQNQFPELAQKTGSPFEILESMDERTRKLIDTFARKEIVEQHPEWINEALTQLDMEEKEIFLSSKSEKPFAGISHVSEFAALLDSQDELVGYTQNQTHYYRILVRNRSQTKEVLSYKEALKNKLLDKLSEKLQVEAIVEAVVEATPEKYKSLAYAYRFAGFVAKYHDSFPEASLAKQFPIEKSEKTITRSEPSFIALDEVLSMQPNALSTIKVDAKEGAYLYRFTQKRVDLSFPLEKMIRSQQLLSQEARARYFEKILKTLHA